MNSLELAQQHRKERASDLYLDEQIKLLFSAKTTGPHARKKLAPLLKYYAKKPHPFTACVAPETPIDMPRDHDVYPDGVPINKIREGDLVWSFNFSKWEFELKRVNAVWIAREDAELVQITLDSGKKIQCTPDHQFLLRTGEWVKACDLRKGDSMVPLYRDFTPRVRVKPNSLRYESEHKVVGVTLGKQEGLSVHHKDQRHRNSSPANIELHTRKSHIEAHHTAFSDGLEQGESWRCPDCSVPFVPSHRNQKRCSDCQSQQGYQHVYKGKQALCFECESEYTVNSINHKFCSAECRHSYKGDRDISAKPALANHQITGVRTISRRSDVWDMEVEDNHSFVVHGIVAHNCVRDNRKRFGPRTEAICATLKDIIRGTTKWRKGRKKNLSEVSMDELVDPDAPEIDEETAALIESVDEHKLQQLIWELNVKEET